MPECWARHFDQHFVIVPLTDNFDHLGLPVLARGFLDMESQTVMNAFDDIDEEGLSQARIASRRPREIPA